MNNCKKCDGSGIYYKPNGDADFEAEYCTCPEGKKAEKAGAMQVLKLDFVESEGSPMLIIK